MKNRENSFSGNNQPNPERSNKSRYIKVAGALASLAVMTACGTNISSHDKSPVAPTPTQSTVESTTTQPTITPPEKTQEKQPITSEQLIVDGLADPDVYKQSEDSYWLTGTAPITNRVPLYHSDELTDFSLAKEYNPNELDPDHDYCNIWAPDISKTENDNTVLLFTARQTENGQRCENSSNDQAIFLAESTDGEMDFGEPHPLTFGPGAPNAHVEKPCPPEGCEYALRIDPEIVESDGSHWLYYTSYGDGYNFISAVNTNNPTEHHNVAIPGPGDGTINEAPDIFERNGKYYMLYSHNRFDEDYGLDYISSDNLAGLTTASSQPHTLSEAQYAPNGQITENSGGSSVVEKDGKYYIFYHKGEFNNGVYTGKRSTYAQQLHFNGDEIEPIITGVTKQ